MSGVCRALVSSTTPRHAFASDAERGSSSTKLRGKGPNPELGAEGGGVPLQCWSCNHTDIAPVPNAHFFCGGCDTVQPPQESGTFFELFGIPEQFSVDRQALKDSFRSLQKRLHPDFFHDKTEQEQVFSADQSASLNHAFNVLSKPHLRVVYLLSLHGITIDESLDDMELLMEVMEKREFLENCTDEEAKDLAQRNAKDIEKLEKDLADLIDVKQDFVAAKETVVRLQYLMRIASAAEGKVAHEDDFN